MILYGISARSKAAQYASSYRLMHTDGSSKKRNAYSDAFGTRTPAVTFAPERSARSHNTEKNVPASV